MLSFRCRNVISFNISFLSTFGSFWLLEESSEEEDSHNAILPSFHLFVVEFELDVLRSSTVEEVRFASVDNAFEQDSGMPIHCCVFEKVGK